MYFSFNGIAFEDRGLKVVNISNGFMSGRNNNYWESPGLPGGLFLNSNFKVREVVLECLFLGENESDYMRMEEEFSTMLYTKQPVRLHAGREDRFYYAILDGESKIDEQFNLGKVKLVFKCFDPFAYSISETVISGTGAVNFRNDGNVETYPVISFRASSQLTNYEVKLANTGERLLFDKIPSGTNVVIDCKAGVVTFNGVNSNNSLDYLSEFFAIQLGQNTINCSGQNFTVTYVPRYLK